METVVLTQRKYNELFFVEDITIPLYFKLYKIKGHPDFLTRMVCPFPVMWEYLKVKILM